LNLPFQTNPTQVAGLLAFAATTAACVWAARRQHSSGWAVLAAVHAALWLDILLNTRHRVHDVVNAALRALGLYESRVWLQAALLLVLAAVAMIAWRARRRAGLAVVATATLIALMLVEAISWHESDRLLYTHLGPLLLIAYAWLACSGVVVFAALRR
jgi:ABC-type proline/glycine betaine transport system permease subunit